MDFDFSGSDDLGRAATSLLGAVAVVSGLRALFGLAHDFAKKSKKSGKEKGNRTPSWFNKEMIPEGNAGPPSKARQVMNNRYPDGDWQEGPGEEYNQIKKYIERQN